METYSYRQSTEEFDSMQVSVYTHTFPGQRSGMHSILRMWSSLTRDVSSRRLMKRYVTVVVIIYLQTLLY